MTAKQVDRNDHHGDSSAQQADQDTHSTHEWGALMQQLGCMRGTVLPLSDKISQGANGQNYDDTSIILKRLV